MEKPIEITGVILNLAILARAVLDTATNPHILNEDKSEQIINIYKHFGVTVQKQLDLTKLTWQQLSLLGFIKYGNNHKDPLMLIPLSFRYAIKPGTPLYKTDRAAWEGDLPSAELKTSDGVFTEVGIIVQG